MKKFGLVLMAAILSCWMTVPSYAALNTVAASRADNATDRTDGITFDNLGVWTLTVADGNSLGTTAGVAAATAGAGGANAGTLTFAGDTTISGDMGTAANQLLAINFNGSGKTSTMTSGVDTIGATTTTVGSGATAKFGNNTTLTGALVTTAAANTVLNLGGNTVTQTGITTLGAASTLRTTLNSSTSFGNVVSSGNAVIGAVTVDAVVAGGLTSGTALKVLDGGAGGTNGATITVTDNSARYSFTGANATGDITITPTLVDTATVTQSANTNSVATSLNGSTSTATGDFSTVQGVISNIASSSDLDNAYAQLDPVVDAGAIVAGLDASNQSLNSVITHLGDVRSPSGQTATTGVSSGDSYKDDAFWIKGFGSYLDQDNRGGVDGYTAATGGTAIGWDWPLAQDWRFGLGGGYAYSAVDSDGVGNAETDVHSIQGTAYASTTQDPWYVDMAFSFVWNLYDASRDIAISSINRQATADYDGQQYVTYIGGGYVNKVDAWEITPLASLQWTHLEVDSYTEDGAGSLNLNVSAQDYDVLQSGLGLKLAYPMTVDAGALTPSISGKWLYDFIGDAVQTSSTFTGGGAAFTTNGFDPAQHSFDIGAELKLVTHGDWTLVANYDLELKEDFTGHSGVLTGRYQF